MPRHRDPELEERILNAAHALWKRGGEHSLTMRAVARVAGTNTPAVYRRFKNRRELVRGLLHRIVAQIGQLFETGKTIEGIAEAYVEYALKHPHDYELFSMHSYAMLPSNAAGRLRPIRESRPNFALAERLLAQRFGGTPDDHTQLTLAIWATLHGTCTLLLSKATPGHEPQLRKACRAAVKALLAEARSFDQPPRASEA